MTRFGDALLAATVPAVLFALCACAPKPSEAPATAAQRVQPTTAGLLELFRQECFEQRNLRWAREESDRRTHYYCNSLMANEGDCESASMGSLEWTSSTTHGEVLKVYLSWGDVNSPHDQRAACGIEVPERLGPTLRQVASIVAEENFGPTLPPVHYSYGQDEYWQWSVNPPRLHLENVRSQRSWTLRLMVHPDFPENYNFVRDHVMRECPLNSETNVYECTLQAGNGSRQQ
jgi:hypothetical protein